MTIKACLLNLGSMRCIQLRSATKSEYNITRLAYRFYLGTFCGELLYTTILNIPYIKFYKSLSD